MEQQRIKKTNYTSRSSKEELICKSPQEQDCVMYGCSCIAHLVYLKVLALGCRPLPFFDILYLDTDVNVPFAK